MTNILDINETFEQEATLHTLLKVQKILTDP